KSRLLLKAKRAFWGRRFFHALGFICLLTLGVSQSVSWELAFYGQNLRGLAASRESEIQIATDLKAEKRLIEARLAARTTNRTPGAVEAHITAALAQRAGATSLGAATQNCTDAGSRRYRSCQPVLILRAELGEANRNAADELRLKAIRQGGKWVT